MKIIITGGTGFLGRNLVNFFVEKGHCVTLLIRKSSKIDWINDKKKSIQLVYVGDESYKSLLNEDVKKLIIHCATDYGRGFVSPFWGNQVFPMELLENLKNNKNNIFLNIDSFFSRDNKYDYLKEYSLSKRQFREWGKLYSDSGELRFINIVIYHMYGHGDSLNKFIPSMMKRLLDNESDIELTDGLQKRDFIYIDDVTQAIYKIFSHELISDSKYKEYEIGSGHSISIKELILMMKEIANSNSSLKFGAKVRRPGEFEDSLSEITELRKIGWLPTFSLAIGLRKLAVEVEKKMRTSKNE